MPTLSTSEVALICPAQGSPVPATRYFFFFFLTSSKIMCFLLLFFVEPSTNTKPKLATNRKVEFVEVNVAISTNLMCPLQGHPAPRTRFISKIKFFLYINVRIFIPCPGTQ